MIKKINNKMYVIIICAIGYIAFNYVVKKYKQELHNNIDSISDDKMQLIKQEYDDL